MEVSDGIYSFTPDVLPKTSFPYASLFAVTGEGVLAIDSMDAVHSAAFLEDIKKTTVEPIKYLIHTHNHWDHNGGNYLFRLEGAQLVAHQDAADWMRLHPHGDMLVPDTVWSGEPVQIDLGNLTTQVETLTFFKRFKFLKLFLQLYYTGVNHGKGMTVVYFPEHKLIYSADLVMPKRVIFAVVPDFNIQEWMRTLEDMLELDFDKGIFTHSSLPDPIAPASRQDVMDILQFLKDLRNSVLGELVKGKNPFDIAKELKLPAYEDWVGYDEFLPMNIWKIMMEELLGPYPVEDFQKR